MSHLLVFKIFWSFFGDRSGKALGFYWILRCFISLQVENGYLPSINQTDDDPEELMDCLAKTFKAVDLGPNCQWKDKLLLGYWTVLCLHLSTEMR